MSTAPSGRYLFQYIPGVGKIPVVQCPPCPTGPTGAQGIPGEATNTGATGPPGPSLNSTYATFISERTQTPDATNPETAPVAITYDSRVNGTINVDGSYPTSRIQIPTTGTYKVTFSAQCDTVSGKHYLDIWPVINGNSVPNSNTRIRIQSQAESVMTIEYILEFSINDILQFYMVGDTVDARIISISGNSGTSPIIPDIPSMLVTIIRLT